eukprot:UN29246
MNTTADERRKTYPENNVKIDHDPLIKDNPNPVIITMSELKNLKKIGSGSFGEIYKATYWGSKVAFKKSLQKDMGKQSIQDLIKEAEFLAKIPPHHNICRFMGLVNEKSSVGLVMEYIKHGNVKDCAGKWMFSPATKYEILKQAACGVWNLHRMNFIHRDLALRNLLIDL